ncbi:MAG: acetyl-CoA C-acyltransferase [Saprospiraceae bacterium]|nr:acetyl-CoA C-acyltransferase [Candidatus Vicinibacter affinis]MBP6172631.1 acetyl-CoA C-acyltransferase [Saprospiraceae bacterium]MBK6571067.1 acetyl-CoA C-acyltransferase [Candidatus Vicinibacter affinis]MBK6822707.1 acetyl-CoA C-acyltransferase [Candidatus Vicinibacter affinis]MBK7304803.1 acetyl-CoA C-acyltransferase [Candidatus Vicinibacter affinis]
MKEVFIVSIARTPIGSFGGALAGFSATKLGAFAIKEAISKAGIDPSLVEDVYFGNVVSSNLGQAPARQAALWGGLSNHTNCTTINKVCASGMKSIMIASQCIQLGQADIVVAGGMESMSNIPYYLPQARWGLKYGAGELVDGLQKDGLVDVYDNIAMGVCGDETALQFGISREAQDAYAIQSYQRSAEATKEGRLKAEIVPVVIPQKKGDPIIMNEDEEFRKVDFSKIPGLKPVFTPNGTVTAANASTMNDGAAALVLMSGEKVKELNLTPIARIVAYADAEQAPRLFASTPTVVAPLALKRAGLKPQQIDFWEVNEAFSVVPLVFAQEIGVDQNKLNVNGGAISLGHPLGASGARIVSALSQILHQNNGQYGLATICNGGGGGSALIIEKV